MATITKIDITENLIEKYQLPKNEAKKVVENFFEEVRISLESGHDVKLSGFKPGQKLRARVEKTK